MVSNELCCKITHEHVLKYPLLKRMIYFILCIASISFAFHYIKEESEYFALQYISGYNASVYSYLIWLLKCF